MEIIQWAHGEEDKGQTIQLDEEEARELIYLISKALKVGKAKSGWFDIPLEIEIRG